MAIVTLLTDFGTDDAYAGMMKGVILSVNPAATIVDITHNIEPHDLTRAAYTISASFKYFPRGTVNIVVVDPGVGGERAVLAMEMKGYCFLAPDNGVLTLLLNDGDADSVVRVENSNFFLEPVSRTFHGRDIFAPVGAHISKGVDLKALGTAIDPNDTVRLDIRKPFVSGEGELVGSIVSIDRFGNLMTDIDAGRLATFRGPDANQGLQILFGGDRLDDLSESYSQAEPMRPLAIMGSLGYLEIAVNCGSARRHYRAEKGQTVRVVKPQVR